MVANFIEHEQICAVIVHLVEVWGKHQGENEASAIYV